MEWLSSRGEYPDASLKAESLSAKMANKQRLAQYVLQVTAEPLDPDSLFDIQVKRIHEYKRQLLNILGVLYRYTKLKVLFVPNYNVSVPEVLIPGSALSQHISTAGMEAGGTSNMQFAVNGCLIICTLPGANVEIREEIGAENVSLFRATADEVPRLRKERENGLFSPDPRFEEAKRFIRDGVFGSYDYNPLLDSLERISGYGRGHYFCIGSDFPSYTDAQEKVDVAYRLTQKDTVGPSPPNDRISNLCISLILLNRMDPVPDDVSEPPPVKVPNATHPAKEDDGQASAVASGQHNSAREAPTRLSPTGISSWAKNLQVSPSFSGSQDKSSSGNVGKSAFARLTSNLGLRLSPKSPVAPKSPVDDSPNEPAAQSNLFGTITKGLVDSSKTAVKAVQVKARHAVSQNKRRYQVLLSFK